MSAEGYALKVGLHGTVGGTVAELQGGSFGHGFASSATTAAASPYIHNPAGDIVPQTVVAALTGGTVSEISGGKFANGALTSALQFAFNQAVKGGPSNANDDASANHEYVGEARIRMASLGWGLVEVAWLTVDVSIWSYDRDGNFLGTYEAKYKGIVGGQKVPSRKHRSLGGGVIDAEINLMGPARNAIAITNHLDGANFRIVGPTAVIGNAGFSGGIAEFGKYYEPWGIITSTKGFNLGASSLNGRLEMQERKFEVRGF